MKRPPERVPVEFTGQVDAALTLAWLRELIAKARRAAEERAKDDDRAA